VQKHWYYDKQLSMAISLLGDEKGVLAKSLIPRPLLLKEKRGPFNYTEVRAHTAAFPFSFRRRG
jgi:hypothetical protein